MNNLTQSKFYEHICNLEQKFQNRDLETYLLALLELAEQEKSQIPTAEFLLKLLQEAFTSEPAEFNPEWLNIQEAPDDNVDKSIDSGETGFDYSISVLQFQISELHKMRGKQLNDEMRYFGIDSETGNRWYNFDPMTNLECGARGIGYGDNGEVDLYVSWQTLGELLEMGRMYE